MAGFDLGAFTKELQVLERGGFQQVQVTQIDMGAAVTDKEIEIQANALLILRTVLREGAELPSNVVGRIWVKLNSKQAPAIPMSLVANSQDFTAIAATIRKIYVTVLAGAVSPGTQIWLAFLLGVSVFSTGAVGGTSGAGGYIPPSGGGGA